MKKILVVVDMQNDFINGSLGTPEAQAILPKVVEKISNTEDGTYFIFTRDTHQTDYLNTPEGKKLPVEHCIENTHGWQIAEEIENLFTFMPFILNKPTFGSTELIDYLNDIMDCQEDTVIEFCGLCTDICVVSNVLLTKAYFPAATIVVDSACCAGVTPASHEAALTTMKMCQIDVI